MVNNNKKIAYRGCNIHGIFIYQESEYLVHRVLIGSPPQHFIDIYNNSLNKNVTKTIKLETQKIGAVRLISHTGTITIYEEGIGYTQLLEIGNTIRKVEISLDGTLLAIITSSKGIILFSIKTKKMQILEEVKLACSLSFSPDNKLLAVGSSEQGSLIRL